MSQRIEPFVAIGPDAGELTVNVGQLVEEPQPVVVAPLRPGRRNTEEERSAQREAILGAALRSVQQHGAIGLQPEKVAAMAKGVTSQSMRRAFGRQLRQLGANGSKRSLRDVLEDELIDAQLRDFEDWLQSDRVTRLRTEDGMVEGLRLIARALLRNPALTRLRTTDRERLEQFLTGDARAGALVEALCQLAIRCLKRQPGRKPDPERLRKFVTRNLRLLADDVALVLLDSDDGARCFVKHLKRYATE